MIKKLLFQPTLHKICKNYSIKTRPEQQSLRKYLLRNKKHQCILCDKYLPLCLLETAHIKPRQYTNNIEKKDKNIVCIMCRYCHSLYDNGYLGVNDGKLKVNSNIKQYPCLIYEENKVIDEYNNNNMKYFLFHYNTIMCKNSK